MVQCYRNEDRETQAPPLKLCEQCGHREVYCSVGDREKRESGLQPLARLHLVTPLLLSLQPGKKVSYLAAAENILYQKRKKSCPLSPRSSFNVSIRGWGFTRVAFT